MLIIILLAVVFIFIIYLLFDLVTTNSNAFYDKWTKKTLFIWLPFYALPRLIKEIFFDKR